MTPPSPADQLRSLASLSGASINPGLDPDVLKVALIAQARQGGATWADVGGALLGRRDGKLAKRYAKGLARAAERKLLSAGLPGLEEVPR